MDTRESDNVDDNRSGKRRIFLQERDGREKDGVEEGRKWGRTVWQLLWGGGGSGSRGAGKEAVCSLFLSRCYVWV